MTFHMPDSWYIQPDAEHACPDEPDECRCAERDDDLREDELLHRQEEEQGR